MSRIRSGGNRSTELRLIKLFRIAGVSGWRRNQKLFGRPDFVFRKSKTAVFVDGCFWHGCPKHFRQPVGNFNYWSHKIFSNRRRDAIVTKQLADAGWRVVRIWEHELLVKSQARLVIRLRRILQSEVRNTPA
jgi:DNA mismatch endonuclease, patch repair protein